MGLLDPEFRSRPASFCVRSGRLGKKPKKLHSSAKRRKGVYMMGGMPRRACVFWVVWGRRASLILAVPAHILRTQNQSIFTFLVHLPAEQGDQGFFSLSEQAPLLPHRICFAGICRSPRAGPAICSFQSVVDLCCVLGRWEAIIHLPQLLPGNEANQYSHCTCVYSKQIFVYYIVLYLKYQWFYLTFLNKNICFLPHKTVKALCWGQPRLYLFQRERCGCVCHIASPTCPLTVYTPWPHVPGAGIFPCYLVMCAASK